MSTILLNAARFDESQTDRFGPASGHALWSFAAKAWVLWTSLRDGLAAYRQYEHLRSWGVQRDVALGEALRISAEVSPGRQ
jgi:hypothetical protein